MSKKFIQIVCTVPGLRRNGTTHASVATYPEGEWTKQQLDAFKADPAFIVTEHEGTPSAGSDAQAKALEQALAAQATRFESERETFKDQIKVKDDEITLLRTELDAKKKPLADPTDKTPKPKT